MLPDGRSIQGVIGFISIINKISREIKTTHVLVVFDPEEVTTRATMFPLYKQNRQDLSSKPERENPYAQLADIKKALDSLSIKYIEQPGYEADDMIASYASQVSCKVVIASADTDFLQLINKRTTVFRYHGKKSTLFNEQLVQERYIKRLRLFLNVSSSAL